MRPCRRFFLFRFCSRSNLPKANINESASCAGKKKLPKTSKPVAHCKHERENDRGKEIFVELQLMWGEFGNGVVGKNHEEARTAEEATEEMVLRSFM